MFPYAGVIEGQRHDTTLQYVLTCLHDSQAKVDFLQIQSQVQHDEIKQRNQRSKLIIVQNNTPFEFGNGSYQMSTHDQLT